MADFSQTIGNVWSESSIKWKSLEDLQLTALSANSPLHSKSFSRDNVID